MLTYKKKSLSCLTKAMFRGWRARKPVAAQTEKVEVSKQKGFDGLQRMTEVSVRPCSPASSCEDSSKKQTQEESATVCGLPPHQPACGKMPTISE